jgi:hypothetical protein
VIKIISSADYRRLKEAAQVSEAREKELLELEAKHHALDVKYHQVLWEYVPTRIIENLEGADSGAAERARAVEIRGRSLGSRRYQEPA